MVRTTKQSRTDHLGVYWKPLTFTLCALVAVIGLAAYVHMEERRRLEDHIDGLAIYTAHWMEDRIDADVETLERMAQRWLHAGGGDWDAWQADALEHTLDLPEIRAMEWADSTFHIRRVVPLHGNEAAEGIDLTEILAEGDLLVASAGVGGRFTTKAIELVQGGTGFVVYQPLYLDGSFEGLMIAVFDVNRLVDLLAESEFGRDAVIAFGQDGQVFGVTSGEGVDVFSSDTFVNLAGREWSVSVSAKPALLARFLSWNPVLTLLFGLVLCAFLSGTLFYAVIARREQKESEEAQAKLGKELAIANRRFEAAVRGASVGIWDWIDVHGEEVWWSPVLYDLLGMEDRIPMTQSRFLDLVHPQDQEPLVENILAHFTTELPFRVEYRLRHSSGEYRWFLGSGAAICDEAGEPIRMVGSLMDIHELKLTQHNLERASRAKSDFLANMSHEIRTPMNGVLGMAHIMLMSDMPNDLRANIEIIKTSGEAMMEILNDILDISKIEAGRVSLEEKPVRMSSIVGKSVSLHSAQAESRGLTLEVEGLDDLLADEILGDEIRLLQVLGNLVANAVKFTQKGGVRVQVKQEELPGDKVMTRFSVIDTGVGIPTDKLKEIFKPFSQVDTSTTREYGGTGLGLSIAQNLTAMMGGEMGVDSELGKGATFWFTVVNRRNPAEAAEPDSVRAAAI